MPSRRSLPSIKALVTLEAAMRLRSFTAAGRELNVTQAAVSRQVRILEDLFGMPLFTRGHRRVEPTPAGASLGLVLSQALDMVEGGVEALRRSRSEQDVTIGATLAISYFWLLPKLSRFRDLNPDVKIRVVSQDEPFDLRSGPDVVIRYGTPPFNDGATLFSRSDTFFPVCSPSFAAKLGANPTTAELLGLPLIGHDAPDPSWMLWPDWFERVGAGRRSPALALQLSHHTAGIAAAVAGQGITLGWEMILQDLLASGQLVRVGAKVTAEGTYNVVVPTKRANPAAEAFAEWAVSLLSEEP